MFRISSTPGCAAPVGAVCRISLRLRPVGLLLLLELGEVWDGSLGMLIVSSFAAFRLGSEGSAVFNNSVEGVTTVGKQENTDDLVSATAQHAQ